MQPFLQKVSEHIFQHYRDNIDDLTVVFPNKRAGLFLKKYLSEKFQKTIWLPKIYSIEEFIAETSEVKVSEQLTLLLEFYSVYKKVAGEIAQKPDEFIRWANVLLHDFNEIDQYYVDAKSLFEYLSELRAIEQWNPETRELSDFQKQYLKFWNLLGKLYDEFAKHLLKKNLAYQGLAYRIAVDKVKSFHKLVLFGGFNALNKSEEKIIQHLINENRAEILWDADKYYVENENQEAGKFLRRYLFSSFTKVTEKKKGLPLVDDLRENPKHIEIIGVPGNVLQAKVAGEILSTFRNFHDFQNTAVVLADESLLLPVLESLPENVKSLNVTMGYQLKNSPLHDFLNSVFAAHENCRKQKFYYKQVIRILSHPFLNFSEQISALLAKITDVIKKKNKIYISVEEMIKIAVENKFSFIILEEIFSDWQNKPVNAIETANFLIKQRIGKKNFESEIFARYIEIFNQLNSLIEQYRDIDDLQTMRIIFNSIVGSCTVPFSGEPLNGLQVMGVLETRTLDFETVILLSTNEDVIPSRKSQNSFIPFEVKKQFGLPLYSDHDAIFAYHFYRLIQRAKKVFLLYNNDISKSFGTGASEKSRFITQIHEELQKTNKNITITEKILSFPSLKKKATEISVQKNELVFAKLNEFSESGFSPSAINTYLNCPLDFYFKYILRLKVEDDVEENIESATFGNFVHKALQELYAPFIGKNISVEDVVKMKQQFETVVKSAFLSEYDESDISYGKNLLSLKVAEKYIRNFLNSEIEFLHDLESASEKLFITNLETEIASEILIDRKKIKIKGKADRIDRIGNTVRIIDYKTGDVKHGDVTLESGKSFYGEKHKPKALQLLMYAVIYSKVYPQHKIIPAIITLKKISKNFLSLKIAGNEEIFDETLLEFEDELKMILKEIFDSSFAFKHNEESKYCEFCR